MPCGGHAESAGADSIVLGRRHNAAFQGAGGTTPARLLAADASYDLLRLSAIFVFLPLSSLHCVVFVMVAVGVSDVVSSMWLCILLVIIGVRLVRIGFRVVRGMGRWWGCVIGVVGSVCGMIC